MDTRRDLVYKMSFAPMGGGHSYPLKNETKDPLLDVKMVTVAPGLISLLHSTP